MNCRRQRDAISKSKQKPRSALSYREFVKFLPFNGLLFLATYMRIAFLAGYGSAWFAGCHSVKHNNHCKRDLDYNAFLRYVQISNSLAGLFAFLFAGLIGHLSDIYGRKPFLYTQVITTSIAYIFIVCYNNVLIFLLVLSLIGLNGNITPLTPIQIALVSDILPQELRISGFTMIYSVGGCALMLGNFLSFVISFYIMDEHFNFYVILGIFVLALLYLYFFVDESLPALNSESDRMNKAINDNVDAENDAENDGGHRHNSNTENSHRNDDTGGRMTPWQRVNPFYSFRYLCMNPIILWVSLSSSFVGLLNLGLMDITVIVFSGEFKHSSYAHHHSQQAVSSIIAIVFMVALSLGLFLAPTVVLPLYQKCFKMSDMQILAVSLLILVVNCFVIATVGIQKKMYLVFICALIYGIGNIAFTAYNSIVTQYCKPSEKGIAMGVVLSCNGIANIVAPICFGFGYLYLKSIHLQFLVFGVAAAFGFVALLLLLPLKSAIAKQEKEAQRRAHLMSHSRSVAGIPAEPRV